MREKSSDITTCDVAVMTLEDECAFDVDGLELRPPRATEVDLGSVGRISGSSGAIWKSGLRIPGPSDLALRWASRALGRRLCLD